MEKEDARIDEQEEEEAPAQTDEELIESIIAGRRPAPVVIDDLPDAVVNGAFIPREGERVVIEKWLTIGAKPAWLGTTVYVVRRIDPLGSGDLGLYDEELAQSACANYITGPLRGWRFKVPTKGFNIRARRALNKLREFDDQFELPSGKIAGPRADVPSLSKRRGATRSRRGKSAKSEL